jgi:cytochrome c-type biogenesis protein CcmH/NrfG
MWGRQTALLLGSVLHAYGEADFSMIFSRFARHRNLNAGSLLHRADAARDARNWSAARQLYEQHLAFSAADAPIWVQLGHARKESGDLTGAEVAYREALKLAADDADAHLQLGHALKLMGRRDEATACYRQAFKLDSLSRARNGLGDSLKPAKRDRNTRQAGRPALSGDVVANLSGQGDRAHAAEEWAQAAAFYRDYLEAVPNDVEIWIQLGHVTKQMADFAAAERAYRKAASLAPTNVDAMLSLARLLLDLGHHEEERGFRKRVFALEARFEHYQSRVADEPVEIAAEPHQVENALVLDISDLLSCLQNGGTITGIQRVQIGVISAFLAGGVAMSFARWDVVFATPIDCHAWRIRPHDIWGLIDYCTAQQPSVTI